MERIEKVLLLAVLGVALMIVAVMSFLPEGVEPGGGKGSKVAAATGVRPDPTAPPAGTEMGKGIGDLIGAPASKESEGDVAPKTLTPVEDPGKSDAAKSEAGKSEAGKSDAAPSAATKSGSEVGGAPGKEPAKPEDPATAPKQDSRLRVAFQYALSPDYLEYIVQQGDSLQRIVQRVCGSSESLDDVLKVNEELRTNPHLIREGFRLLIPKSAVRSASAPVSEPSGKAGPTETLPTPLALTKPPIAARPSAARAEAGLYTVQAGDTLWKIAVRRRGAKAANAYVAQIQEDNPAARGTLYPGMRLRLP
jgi:nucleoid-associated protein YgaU